MELNDHHHQNLVNFLKFSKYRRSQQLRSVDCNFDDVLDSRVSTEETYTGDELEDMLQELQRVVKGDVESELLDNNHTNCLLLSQLFKQAEKWHLKLSIDTSQLEDKALLDEVAKLEDSTSASTIKQESKTKLAPLQDSGPVPLLQMEIGRLEEENNMLRRRLDKLEIDSVNALQDKGNLKEQVRTMEGQLSMANSAPNLQVKNLMEQVKGLQIELKSSTETLGPGGKHSELPDDYISTKHQLLALQAELERAQGELDKKFSETMQYNNMKKMITKKNDQMKELRGRLRKYEPAEPSAD